MFYQKEFSSPVSLDNKSKEANQHFRPGAVTCPMVTYLFHTCRPFSPLSALALVDNEWSKRMDQLLAGFETVLRIGTLVLA
jgi:hypothetical protein